MNIAIVGASLPRPDRKPGGVEIAIHRLANELARNSEDRVVVFSLVDAPPDALYRVRKLFPALGWLRTKVGVLYILPVLLNLLDFTEFDILHLHGDDWFYINRSIATLRTMHGSALREAQSATSLKRKLSQIVVYPLEHVSARLATIAVAIGADAARLYGLREVVDNGVDQARFFPGEKTSEPSVLFVGTWLGRKRGKFVYESFLNDVLPQFPDAVLWMACDRCPEHSSVVHLGFPDDDELAARYRRAWVFAYPSTYEGFGIAYVEAMASGTAILTSPNSGAEYVLNGGTYGVFADDADFGACLRRLVANREVRDGLALKGTAGAESFSWGRVAARYRLLYRQAINQHLGIRHVG